MKICVFAASSRTIDCSYVDEAFALGAELARRGHTIVFGGGASGLMGATARGAKSQGGRLIGIAPKFFDEPGILDKDCDEMIFTETMSERKKAMEDMAEELLKLYAQRRAAVGTAFSPDTHMQREFEDEFDYNETDDQLNAVKDIKAEFTKDQIGSDGIIVKRGKKNFMKIVVK